MSKQLSLNYTHTGGDYRRRPNYTFVYLFLLADAAILTALLFAWPIVQPYCGAAIEWDVGQSVHHQNWRDLFVEPYLELWGMPLASCLLAWIAVRRENHQLALICSALPAVLFGMALGWFAYAPLGMR